MLKVWNDNNDQDGKRPGKLIVTLYQQIWNSTDNKYDDAVSTGKTAELNEDNGWKVAWTGLQKYKNGKEILYSVQEPTITEYTLESAVHTGDLSTVTIGDTTYVGTLSTLTNKHTPETIPVTVQKKWEDDDNRDGKRWASVELQLWKKVGTTDELFKTVTLYQTQFPDKNTWSHTWEELDKYEDGERIEYYVKELILAAVTGGYSSGYEIVDGVEDKLTLVNSYTPEKTSVKVQKVWNDSGNRDKIRPSKITFTLQKRVGSAAADAANVTKDIDGNAVNSCTVTVTDGNYTAEQLTHTWENLPVYENGQKIYYTVAEVMENTTNEEHYEKYEDPSINTVEAEKDKTVTVTATNTYGAATRSVSVKKVWVDDGNREAKRPATIQVQLYANEEPVSDEDGGLITLPNSNGTGKWSDEEWTYTWSNLAAKENGTDIKYTVKEVTTISGYEDPVVTTDASGTEKYNYLITNTNEIDKTSRSVEKVWDDDKDRDEVRPGSITVILQQRNKGTNEAWKIATVTGAEQTLKADNDWKYTWDNLPVYEKYVVEGGASETYETVTTGELEYRVVEILTAQMINDGYSVSYALKAEATDDNPNPEVGSYTKDEQTSIASNPITVIKNSREIKKVDKTVTKAWDDNDDFASARPAEVYAWLYKYKTTEKAADAVKAEEEPVKLDANNTWSYNWTGLAKNEEGVELVYMVKEFVKDTTDPSGYKEVISDDDIPGYNAPVYSSVDKDTVVFEITNTHDTEKVSRIVYKYWRGDNAEVRPESIVLQLKMSLFNKDTNGDGVADAYSDPINAYRKNDSKQEDIDPATVTGDIETWSYTWSDLNKTYNGQPIIYSVEEIGYYVKGDTEGETVYKEGLPEGYQVVYGEVGADISGMTVMNIYSQLEISKVSLTTGNELPGAQLAIYAYDANMQTATEEALITLTSGTAPTVLKGTELDKLKVGETYILRETKVPAGYLKAADQTFTLNADGTATKVIMVDAPTAITVSKRAVSGEDELSGATIQILDGKGNVVKNIFNEELEWISGTTPKTITGLAVGVEYTLKETIAPDGYTVASEIKFTIQEDGTVKVGERTVEDNLLIINDDLRPISFAKVDADDKYVKDATLEVHYATGVDNDVIGALATTVNGEVLQWTSGEAVKTFFGIKKGTYFLVETSAPAGYVLADPVKFEVTGEETEDSPVQTVSMTDELTRVRITKNYEGEKFQLSDTDKVVFEITQEGSTQVIETVTINKDTALPFVVEGLAAGNYVLHEVETPAGFTLAENQNFTVYTDRENGEIRVTDVTVENKLAEVTVVKTDATGKITEALKDAEFEVHAADLTDDTQYISEVATNVYGEELKLTTTGDVTVDVLKGIKPGTYYMVETQAPEGYTLAVAVKFTVEANQSVTAKQTVEVKDYPTSVTFRKTDIFKENELAGADLKIVKVDGDGNTTDQLAESIYGQDDVSWVSNGTDHIVEGLKPGMYALVETAAPAGYTIANAIIFVLLEDGTVLNEKEEPFGDNVIEMANAPVELQISKTGFTLDNKVVPLEGAKLEIREKNADGSIGDIVTNVYGEKLRFESAVEAVTLKGVNPGSYWLVETDAPDGYTIADPIEITINEDMTVSQNPLTYIMEDCPTEVTISKTDITTGRELPGAKIQILKKDADGTESIATTIYYVDDATTPEEKLEWVSGDTPKVIRGLPAGDYILREITAPAGYAVAEDVAFTITEEMDVENKVVMEDQPTQVTISKRAMTGRAELPGAALQVLDVNGNVATTIYYVDDSTTPDEKLEWVSGEEAKVIRGLKPGKYTLKETQSPDGYGIAESIEFEITEGGFEAQDVIMRDETTKVQISKMDVTNNQELAGAHLILKDAAGNIIADWVSTGKPKTINGQLIAGATYTLTEVTAPTGYDISRDITFTVNSDGQIQTVVMEDEVSSGNGSITVQKLVMMDGEYTAVDYTFYVALFSDEACTQRVSSVKPLNVSGSYTTSTIFSNLKYGTYYVAETDEFGNAITEGEFIESNQVIDGRAELTPANATAKSTIINHMINIPRQYYQDGEITVDKRVLINGKAGNVTDTFYFALFTDAAMTMMADAGVVELSLNNESQGTVTFANLAYGQYYLAETDVNGTPVDSSYEYEVTISSYCEINAENRTVTRTVTNSRQEESETTTTTTTTTTTSGGSSKTTKGTKPVKTGDDTQILLYLLLLAASAMVLGSTVYGRKRRKKRDA